MRIAKWPARVFYPVVKRVRFIDILVCNYLLLVSKPSSSLVTCAMMKHLSPMYKFQKSNIFLFNWCTLSDFGVLDDWTVEIKAVEIRTDWTIDPNLALVSGRHQ